MAINNVFNPAGIVVTVGHVTVSNLTADDGVKIEMQGDGMQFTVGLDGALVPSLTANRSAKITLSVMQGSTTNDQLQALTGYGTPKLNTTPLPITVIDKSRGSRLVLAPTCYLSKGPGLQLTEKPNALEWEFIAESVVLSLK